MYGFIKLIFKIYWYNYSQFSRKWAVLSANLMAKSALMLDLVAASDCSAYEYEYVALARHLNVKLVTGDKKILQNFPDTAVDITGF